MPHGYDGVERVAEDVVLPPEETLLEAQRLIDTGFPFHAHEVLEARWKASEAPERSLWQGLAQLAVGLTHGQRGNALGAPALLRRGAERIAAYGQENPYGLRPEELAERAVTLAEAIEVSGLGPAGAPAPKLRLR
jgi:predicted metal-dependent hydrolase